MSSLYLSIARFDDQGVVRAPLPGDAIGSALRGVFDRQPVVPDDMLRLLERLNRTPH